MQNRLHVRGQELDRIQSKLLRGGQLVPLRWMYDQQWILKRAVLKVALLKLGRRQQYTV